MGKRTATRLWAVALSLTAAFGSLGCLVSGFDLSPVGFWTALVWTVTAVGFSLCPSRRSVTLSVLSLELLSVVLWLQGSLSGSVEQLLRELSQIYDRAYGWGVLSWGDGQGSGIGMALCFVGLPIVITVCGAVAHRWDTWPAVLLAVLPLGCCMIVTDTVPGTVPLFVILLTVLLMIMTQTVRRRDESQGDRLLAILVLPVAAGLGLLFLLIPQAGYDRQEGAQRMEEMVVSWLQGDLTLPDIPQPTRPPQIQSTLPPDISITAPKQENLKNVGPKIQSDMKIMSVTADADALVYLRGMGFDSYDGTSWTVTAQEDPAWWPEEGDLERQGSVTIATTLVHEALYLPYYAPQAEYGAITNGRRDNSGAERLRRYSFAVGTLDPQKLLHTSAEGYGEDMEPFLTLPEDTQAWALGVIRELFGTDAPPPTAQTVYTIAEYVRTSASYDLATPRMGSEEGDFVRWFLTESDTGYCIHFASATAVLLRAAGIPSRYVTGYTVTAKAAEEVTVTGKHAHAWAEFRLPGLPWCPVESTPDYETEEIPEQTFPQVTTPSLPDETEPTVPQPTEPVTPPAQPPRASWWKWVGAGLGALCVIAVPVQWRVRVFRRRQSCRKGRSKGRALACWRQHALMARLLGQMPEKELLELAQKAKFSQHAITAEELERFAKITEEQIGRLKKKPLWLQLYYTVILALY